MQNGDIPPSAPVISCGLALVRSGESFLGRQSELAARILVR